MEIEGKTFDDGDIRAGRVAEFDILQGNFSLDVVRLLAGGVSRVNIGDTVDRRVKLGCSPTAMGDRYRETKLKLALKTRT